MKGARILTELQRLLAAEYTIDAEFGGGGMSRIFLATERALNRRVVLKVLPPELGSGIVAERFRREMLTLAQFAHPNIVPILRADTVTSEAGVLFMYYVMPFQDGDTLRGVIERERQLPVERAVRIAREVAEALDYAHRRGVVHRDVKPENVILSSDHAMVIDFGVSRALTGGNTTLTSTGVTVGTPSYMSPEQAAADRELDGRSDIYSLGCILFEMLTGQVPHAGPTAQHTLARRLSTPAPDIAAQRSDIAPELAGIMRRALEPAPSDRYASAGEFALALRNIEILSATPSTPVHTVVIDSRRSREDGSHDRRGMWLALGAVAVGLVATAVYFGMRGS